MSISVVLPNYNGQNFLGASIESILGQDFSDFEFLILDDGSTDFSKEIIMKYANYDKRIKPFFLEKMGLVDILNFGIDQSRNKFIARMDGDDIALPDRFSKQLEYFDDPNIGLVGSGTYLVDEMGKFIKYGNYPYDGYINDVLTSGCFVAHPSVIFYRDLFYKAGRYSNKFIYAEDYELWMRMSKITKLKNAKERLLILRQHINSTTIKNFPHQQMVDLIIKIIYGGKFNHSINDIKDINFESIRKFITLDEFKSLKKMWASEVRLMIKPGHLSRDNISPYFLEHLLDA
jgi:glycosyltransferase involved in cell wall biosynthesis